MENIIITCDSGIVSVSPNAIVIPCQVRGEDGIPRRDQVEISNEEIFDRRSKGEKFSTSSPVLGDYLDVFEKYVEDNKIIHLSMSSGISAGSYNSSVIAAEDVSEEKIKVIDTKQGGPGGGLILKITEDLIKEGLSYEEIIEKLEKDIIPRIRTTFIVPDAVGFKESGRSATENTKDKLELAAVKMLKKLGLQLEVQAIDGKLHPVLKYHRFKKTEVKESFVKSVLNSNSDYENQYIFFGSTLAKKDEDKKIIKVIKSSKKYDEIIESNMGAAISSYACDGTLGVSVLKKQLK